VRKLIDNDLLTAFARLFIGIIFIYASIYKIIEPESFAKSIWYYHMVPGKLINLMALILPWLELLCGVAVIAGVYYRGSVALINIMLVVFIVALAATIMRDLDIDCGCFKAGQTATGPAWRSLLADIGMMVFSVQMMLSRSRRWMLAPPRP